MHRSTMGEPCSNQKRLLADCCWKWPGSRSLHFMLLICFMSTSPSQHRGWSAYCWSSGSNASHRPRGANQNDSLGANLVPASTHADQLFVQSLKNFKICAIFAWRRQFPSLEKSMPASLGSLKWYGSGLCHGWVEPFWGSCCTNPAACLVPSQGVHTLNGSIAIWRRIPETTQTNSKQW